MTSILCVLFCTLSFHLSLSQENDSTQQQTLNQQYEEMIRRSETFNDYKVIKQYILSDFWQVVNDSIAQKNRSEQEALSTAQTKQTQLETLKNIIVTKDKELIANQEEKLTITIFGTRVNKSSYVILSIMIVFVLLALIIFLILKTKIGHEIAKIAKKDLSMMEQEYEDYRKRTLNAQIKLKRELQTERNKLTELKK